MPMRLRKFIGMMVLITGLPLYVMFAVAFVGHYPPPNGFVEFLYYLIAGIAWAFPARYLIYWMQRPDDA